MTQRNSNLKHNDREEGVKGIVHVIPTSSNDSESQNFPFWVNDSFNGETGWDP